MTGASMIYGGALVAVLSVVDFAALAIAGDPYARETRERAEQRAEEARQRDVELRLQADDAAHLRIVQLREQAIALMKSAAASARRDDCSTVTTIDAHLRDLDTELHDTVFVRDVAIARCLATAPKSSSPTTAP